jgi:formylmethanofuran dehydrogenase subunit B
MTVCTCTGCSLLCEDIEIDIETGTISHAKNLCRKGWAHFRALYTERTKPTIDGEEVPLE